MADCSNWECNNTTWEDKLKCPSCRHAKISTCCSCGSECPSIRAIRCKECSLQAKSWVRRRIESTKYNSDPEYHKRKNDSSLRSYHRNKRINKTVTVDN